MKENKVKKKHIFLFFIMNLTCFLGQSQIIFDDCKEIKDISSNILIFEDKENIFTIETIDSAVFTSTNLDVYNIGLSKSYFWVKLPITNLSNSEDLLINVSLPTADYLGFYNQQNDGRYTLEESGERFVFENRAYYDPSHIYNLFIPKGNTKVFYINIASNKPIQLPIKIGGVSSIVSEIKDRDILSGVYVGVMLVMIMYNLFLYFTIRDNSYIYYVFYIICILLTQTSLQGYTFQFLWPNLPIVTKYSLFVFPALSAVSGMLFMNVFLKTKTYSKKIYKLSYLLVLPFVFSITIAFFSYFRLSQIIMEVNTGLISVYMLITSILIVRKGYKPARIFLIAWVIFLIGVIVFILKDLGVLPFNNFTRYLMQAGSAIETVLLSFALAARINTYKQERLDALKANEMIIKEQNITLEKNVIERTKELNQTLTDLKSTQSQLVEAEKMSSLGLLTAGIAHEINNPINFVSSNIYPLRQDIADINRVIEEYGAIINGENIEEKLKKIEDLKKELDFDYLKEELETIINGIEEGAQRTSTIVKGLRTFSRLDEGALKDVNINDGIEATLILINTKLDEIELRKELGDIPKIECNPGKLNQVFMNLIDNAIFAVNKRKIKNGYISIKTTKLPSGNIRLTLEDNGGGIPFTVREKMFDPFFTTKKIGEGTGLGLSIVRSIIEEHEGSIKVESEINKGTKIEIELPQKKKNNE